MAFNIVLTEPEIPMNTGSVGRLSLASGSNLHLVKPFGFELTDARVKRAGLDYWKFVSPTIYENIDAFFAINKGKNMAFFSSHAKKTYRCVDYEQDMFLIFGKESVGLPSHIMNVYSDRFYKIPIFSPHVRSLNLSNAVSIVVYEGLRKLGL